MFQDRKDGGQRLAIALEKYRGMQVIVLGIPRGGVETAFYVAEHLQSQFSIVVVRKLGHPGNPEYAFGAIAEDGSTYFAPDTTSEVPPSWKQMIISREKEEIHRRIQTYRGTSPLPDLKGSIVILVDDGIATGATLFAAIKLVKRMQAAKIVVAAPVGSIHAEHAIQALVDEVVILEVPAEFYAVSQAYAKFHNLEDSQVKYFLKQWEEKNQSIFNKNN